jgi:beta-phosphoglucomutase-like phosphatase (HAD superfamily)
VRIGGIRAVLFDFDGTLVNTEVLVYVQAFLSAVKQMGLEKANGFMCDQDIINFYRFKLCGVRRDRQSPALERAFPGADITALHKYFYDNSITIAKAVGVQRKAGVNEIFEYLHNKGIKIAIASMSKRPKLYEFCKIAGIDLTNVACIIGGTDIKNAKPHPEIYLKSMETLGVTPNETVVVEDSSIGAWAGVNAGCKTILVRDFAPVTPEIGRVIYKILNKDCLIQLKELL